MATFFSHFFYLFLACLISVYVAITSFELYYEKPGPSEQEQLLIINKGQSVANIASHLRELNLIEYRMVFILLVRLNGFHDKIKFGEYMIPKTGLLFSMSEILIVNSPFLFINSFVPSSGSISQYFFHFFRMPHETRDSSLNMGIFGSRVFNLVTINSLEFISASVIGELSSLVSTVKPLS